MTDSIDTEVATEVPEPDTDESADETSGDDAPTTDTVGDGIPDAETVDDAPTDTADDADDDRPTDHLEDVGDGCGCAEIWEHLSDEE